MTLKFPKISSNTKNSPILKTMADHMVDINDVRYLAYFSGYTERLTVDMIRHSVINELT